MEIQKEYERILGLFENLIDDKQLSLIDGAIWECARLKVELDNLHNMVNETGLVKSNPKNPMMQKELPVSKVIIKVRANYLNYISKLSSILGKALLDVDTFENDLEEFE